MELNSSSQEWYTYILYSEKINKFYIGSTYNLEWRLERHNMGWGKFTKKGIPWRIVYFEKYDSSIKALTREKEIKNKKSRKYLEQLIQSEENVEKFYNNTIDISHFKE